MASFSAGVTFSDGVANDVTASKLGSLVNAATPISGLIQDRTEETIIATNDTLLIGDFSDSNNLKKMTVANVMKAELTGTINNTAGTIATLNSTTGTIATLRTTTGLNSTTGTVATLNSTNGTIATLNSTTGTITGLNSTNGTIATLNSTTGTITGLNSTNGTIATLNSTAGTIASLNSTAGTIATLNSTTGTITNLSTTLAGDFTVSQGTGTLGTSGVVAGTYGTNTAAVRLDIDSKGRITTVSTSAISATPGDGTITPAKLSQPFTSGTAVATTSGTAVNFTGIPSWAKMITVIFNAVSLPDGADYLVRIGSTTTSSTGYVSTSINNGTGGADGVNSTTGFIVRMGNAADFLSGLMHIVSVSGNTWVSSHRCKRSVSNIIGGGGDCTISGVLDRVQITNTTSTTFDSGSVNIIYQG